MDGTGELADENQVQQNSQGERDGTPGGVGVLYLPTPSQAVEVTQLDITGGSINLNFGVLGTINGNFTADGQLLMN